MTKERSDPPRRRHQRLPNVPDGSDYQTDQSGYDSGVNQNLGLSDTDQGRRKILTPKPLTPQATVSKTPELRLPVSDDEKGALVQTLLVFNTIGR